jgi:hypothetical protein
MSVLKTQFATAVALIEEKKALQARITEWRKKAAGEGLAPGVLLKLAREHTRDENGRRKAVERLEVEELYREQLHLNWLREYRKRRDAERAERAAASQAGGSASPQAGAGE